MKELRFEYQSTRQQAIELMQKGNVSAYLARLVALHDLRLQMINLSKVR